MQSYPDIAIFAQLINPGPFHSRGGISLECHLPNAGYSSHLIWHGTHQPWLLETRVEPAEHENEFQTPLFWSFAALAGTGLEQTQDQVWHFPWFGMELLQEMEPLPGQGVPLNLAFIPHFQQ